MAKFKVGDIFHVSSSHYMYKASLRTGFDLYQITHVNYDGYGYKNYNKYPNASIRQVSHPVIDDAYMLYRRPINYGSLWRANG